MRRSVLFSIIFLAGVTVAGFWSSSGKAADLTTPEKAISAYIDAVAHQDFKAIIAATATDKMSAQFDFVAFASRLQMLSASSAMPPTDPLFIEINRAKFTSQISQQVQLLIYGLMTKDDFVNNNTMRIDAAGAGDFASMVRADRLKGLSLVKVGIPNPEMMNNKIHQANMALIAGNNGADEMTERVALLSFEENQYAIGFTLLRYGEDWAVLSQTSRAAATNGLGAPGRMSPAGFEQMLR
ncbi:hypothetical protein O8B93_20335 [Agrobacterium rhizogenes]|uniref:hypothetical protein n=1 Tax=Rhizobium rhizogenes TaxID=359 RepID=UPI0022B7023E|nr:hypothetical protein [Rhizobium rhizogenes]MCZ7449935.1 hypothetical protein [Rhizobium rhizogenes]